MSLALHRHCHPLDLRYRTRSPALGPVEKCRARPQTVGVGVGGRLLLRALLALRDRGLSPSAGPPLLGGCYAPRNPATEGVPHVYRTCTARAPRVYRACTARAPGAYRAREPKSVFWKHNLQLRPSPTPMSIAHCSTRRRGSSIEDVESPTLMYFADRIRAPPEHGRSRAHPATRGAAGGTADREVPGVGAVARFVEGTGPVTHTRIGAPGAPQGPGGHTCHEHGTELGPFEHRLAAVARGHKLQDNLGPAVVLRGLQKRQHVP